jgi:NAD dependent epimerase/dehydratase family enzyme
VLTIALQDAARDLLLASQRAVPARLLADGFRFRHGTVEEALDAQFAATAG